MQFLLEIIEGRWNGYNKLVTEPTRILIGRDNSCDFTIPDPLLSRQHCLVEFTPQQVKIIDLKSRNGTYVNGDRVEEKQLQLNDKIKIGRHTLNFTIAQGQADPASPPFSTASQQANVPTRPQAVVAGLCSQCGAKISQQDLKTMKAVKHGGYFYCEHCLSRGIEVQPQSTRKATQSAINPVSQPYSTIPKPIDSTTAPSAMPSVGQKFTQPMSVQAKPRYLSSLPPGTPEAIGHYQILEILGEGGMGFVFKAQHTFLETIVAIKVIKDELAAQPDILKRFLQEARLGISLDHSNILRIHDAGEADGIFFISMEFFEGKDITEIIKKQGPIPYNIMLKWAIQMADALGYAHSHGVIHRDVKPSNILVNSQGLVKIADFGLAKAWQKAGANQLTASGQMLGTIQYISPEQLENSRTVDPKTDIFSLGASIYYTIIGTPPFGQEPIGKVIQNILHNDPPPLSEKIPDIPPALEEVIMRSLEKNSAERIASMQEFKTILEEILRQVGN